MNDVRIAHELPCDEDTFWQACFFDDEFNRRLYLEQLGFHAWRVAKSEDRGGSVVRVVESTPNLANVPGPVKKVIGERLSYLENGTFDRATKVYTFDVTPSTLADRTRIHGVLRCEPAGAGRVRRIVEVKVEVKVFAVGGMVEDRIAADMRASYDKAAEFTVTWLAGKRA